MPSVSGRLRQERQLPDSVIAYNATISACEKGEQWQWALQLLTELEDQELEGTLILGRVSKPILRCCSRLALGGHGACA